MQNALLEFLILLLAVLVAVLAVVTFVRRLVRRTVILEHQRGLLYVNGRFTRVLEPGTYWHLAFRDMVTRLDLRSRAITIPGQEVLSADNVSLKVSLAVRYRVSDPYVAVSSSESYDAALYQELQLALREIVGGARIDDLLARRDEISRQLHEMTAEKAVALGLELVSVGIKDLMFPGELKKIFAQVVNAQKEGLAALERARGETAALRNLTNAARMVEAAPVLLQLRLIQALGEGKGNTMVLGLPNQTTPLPVRSPDSPNLPEGGPESGGNN